MSTHVPRFHSFFRIYASFCINYRVATSSVRVKHPYLSLVYMKTGVRGDTLAFQHIDYHNLPVLTVQGRIQYFIMWGFKLSYVVDHQVVEYISSGVENNFGKGISFDMRLYLNT